MNKRAASANYVLIIIVSVFVLLVLAPLFGKLFAGTTDDVDKRICQASIIIANKTNDPSKIDCKRNEVLIKGNKVFDSSGLEEDKFYKIIAKEMYNCKDIIRNFNPYGKSEDVYCMVCAEITFDDSFKEKAEGKQIGLPFYWMAINKIPQSERTYQEFLAGHTPSEVELQNLKNAQSSQFIDPNEKYVVIARTDSEGFSILKAIGASAGGAGAGAGTGALAGATVLFIPVVGEVLAPFTIPIGGATGAIVGGTAGWVGYVDYVADVKYNNVIVLIPEKEVTGDFITQPKIAMCNYLIN